MDQDLLARTLGVVLPELTRFARWLVASVPEADDLVHEVVVRALESAATIEDPSRLRAWLFRTARNARVDLWRSGAARSRLLVLQGGLDDLEQVAIPPVPTPPAFERADIEHALARLPESARTALLLVDLWQFSYEEVASILDIPVGTVRSRLARGRSRLAQLLLDDPADRAAGGDA